MRYFQRDYRAAVFEFAQEKMHPRFHDDDDDDAADYDEDCQADEDDDCQRCCLRCGAGNQQLQQCVLVDMKAAMMTMTRLQIMTTTMTTMIVLMTMRVTGSETATTMQWRRTAAAATAAIRTKGNEPYPPRTTTTPAT